MGKDIFFVLWLFLPAALANMAPIVAAQIPWLRGYNAPIDGGRTFRGQAIFGSHKTWRGLVSGMVLATAVLWLQQLAVAHSPWLAHLTGHIDYRNLPVLLVGPLLGLGALGGDAIESFFKRQRGVQPGHSWFPFDQLDYIVGGAIAILPFVRLTPTQYVWLAVVWLAVHLIASYAGWLIGWKERPL